MYTLNTGKVGVATDNLVTFSTQNKTTYNGVEFTVNVAARQIPAVRRRHDDDRRAVERRCDDARQPEQRSRSATRSPPFRTTVKASARVLVPVRHPGRADRSPSIPGPGVSANYTVTSAIAGRPIIGSTAGAASTSINLVEPGTLFLDYQNRLDLRLGKTFRLDRTRSRDSRTSSTCSTRAPSSASTRPTPRRHEPWLTPTAIMEGRYVRFGLQMSF